jgi:hypothetical protein
MAEAEYESDCMYVAMVVKQRQRPINLKLSPNALPGLAKQTASIPSRTALGNSSESDTQSSGDSNMNVRYAKCNKSATNIHVQ